MRFNNCNGIMWWREKGEGKVILIFRVFSVLWKWKHNACFNWNHFDILLLYCFALCHTSYLFCCWSPQPVFYMWFFKHYARCNSKRKFRLVLSLEISRDRDKLLTLSGPAQFYGIFKFNSMSLMLDVIFFTILLLASEEWKIGSKK